MALRLILSLFLLIGLAQPGFARLGETEAELIARYGEPKRPHQTDPQIIELSFVSEGWIIKALICLIFDSDRSDALPLRQSSGKLGIHGAIPIAAFRQIRLGFGRDRAPALLSPRTQRPKNC